MADSPMDSPTAGTVPIEAVPIDLSPWATGDETARDEVARALDHACRTTGFLAVTGHGIDPALIDEMVTVTTSFFDLPTEAKLAARTGDLVGNRGYAPPESEALSYSLGVDSPPDLFEAFNAGPTAPPRGADPEVVASFFAPNVWPDEPAGMRDVWERWFAACAELGDTLLDVCARALGLADGWFRPLLTEQPSVIRANNYERRAGTAPDPEQLGMGAHSDYGSLTILWADPVPGLQIRDGSGRWHDLLPPEGGFLVNLGDLLAEWTNDRWRSTVHRVLPPPAATRRRSIAWFQQPNHDARIEVLDVCVDDDHPPKYPPTTAGGHLLAKLMGPRTGGVVDVDPNFLDRS